MTIDVLIKTQNVYDQQPNLAGLGEDLVWGVKAISETIGLTERQTLYLLETGRLPAKKVGRRWYSSISSLRKHFTIDAEVA